MHLRGGLALVLCCALPLVAHAATTGNSGSGVAHVNMQPSLGTNYIIALQGIFPDHQGGAGSGIEPFVGEISLVASNFAPQGWALAQGQLLPINQNQALFSLLGTNYGGNGTTNFALPDLRGRVPIGFGQGPGLTNRPIGQQVGQESVALTAAQMPAHSHSLPGGGTTSATGSSASHTEMQPSLAMNYMIALQGIFPPRSGGSGSGVEPFVAQVALVASNFEPPGWAFADGRLLNIAQNAPLFSLLGTTYGGNGTTTFALPDLRGRAAMGVGQGVGLTNRQLGQSVGAEALALSNAQLPAHTHSLPGGATGSTGGGAAHSNMQPSLGLNYIISLYGVYPSQGGAGSSDTPYVGEIRLFAGNFAPAGWSFADGSLISIAENTALFNLLGTTYGGNGSTNFALPDYRGRLAVGMGQGPGLSSRSLGSTFGVESVALSVAQLSSHAHTYNLPGDFNLDNNVNAADYVMWRHGLGTAATTPQYNLWLSGFGQSGGGGADGTESHYVPEPAAFTLLLLAIAGMCCAILVRWPAAIRA